jgi:hypothetical protein
MTILSRQQQVIGLNKDSSNDIDIGYVATIVIVLILIFAMYLWLIPDTYDKERFAIHNYPQYCNECGVLGPFDCNNCTNCGNCLTPNGNWECVTGDENGPYFRKDMVDMNTIEKVT